MQQITPVVYPHPSLDVVDSSLEEVAHLEIWFSHLEVGLHVAVGVVDDGQEHVLVKGIRLTDALLQLVQGCVIVRIPYLSFLKAAYWVL